jgi:hypothetical protein
LGVLGGEATPLPNGEGWGVPVLWARADTDIEAIAANAAQSAILGTDMLYLLF